jgi:hypothetical protein
MEYEPEKMKVQYLRISFQTEKEKSGQLSNDGEKIYEDNSNFCSV